MTDAKPKTQRQSRYRRTRAELDALRLLAREAALRGEGLASIRARLHIPENTLTVWARQDGFRQQDLQARAEAQAASGEAAEAVAAIRQQADELWEMMDEMADRPVTGARRQVDMARARTLALVEAGYYEAAEEEIASIRQLARLLSFGRAGTDRMERFQNQAAVIVREKGLERVMETVRRINEEAEAERAAREAAGLPPLPPTEPKPVSKEEADAFYAKLREKGRNRDYWSELAELRRREREEGEAQVGGLGAARARASTSLEP